MIKYIVEYGKYNNGDFVSFSIDGVYDRLKDAFYYVFNHEFLLGDNECYIVSSYDSNLDICEFIDLIRN